MFHPIGLHLWTCSKVLQRTTVRRDSSSSWITIFVSFPLQTHVLISPVWFISTYLNNSLCLWILPTPYCFEWDLLITAENSDSERSSVQRSLGIFFISEVYANNHPNMKHATDRTNEICYICLSVSLVFLKHLKLVWWMKRKISMSLKNRMLFFAQSTAKRIC